MPVLVSALGPRLLRVAGELADGTVLWMAPPRAIETHIAPKVRAAAAAAGRPAAAHRRRTPGRGARRRRPRPAPRLPRTPPAYAGMANYQRILEHRRAPTPADAAIVGDEAAVRAQLQSLLDAGATDIWAAVFPVGDDRAASLRRTTDLLKELVA